MSEQASLPPRARLLIPGVIVSGAVCLAIGLHDALSWTGADGLAFGAVAAAVALGEWFPLSLRHRTETLHLSLSDAVWTSALVLLFVGDKTMAGPRPGILILGVGTGVLVGQGARGRAPVKLAFNVAQFMAAITIAEGVFRMLHPERVLDPMTWLAAVISMAAFLAVNMALTNLVIALVEERSFLSVLTPSIGPVLLHWTGNVTLGLLAAVLWDKARIAMPLLLAPLAFSYLAYRAWLHERKEQERLSGLYSAGQTLLGPLDETNFGEFLGRVRTLLDADHAELVLVEGDRVIIRDAGGCFSLAATREPGGSPTAEAFVRVRNEMLPHIVPISGGRGSAILAVHKNGSMSHSERSLLDSLASQVSSRLLNQDLYSETVRQRTELADIIHNTSDGICMLSTDGHILSWNPAMEGITGFSAQESEGKAWQELLSPSGRLGSEPSGSSDAQIVRKDRTVRWVRSVGNPILEPEGNVKAYVLVVRDVTAELETEQLKADFVATVSHELRTPLTPLKGFLAALVNGTVEDSPDARMEYYGIMLKQTNRLERLIADLLEVSRIESTAGLVHNEVVELKSLVEGQIQQFCEDHPDRTICFSATGPVAVQADPLRVGQVVGNLISNALKYSPSALPIEVTVSRSEHHGVVAVRDHGEGISHSEQERIFERFYRGGDGLTRSTTGTGLGLYIAKRLVDAMSGRLFLVSNPGQGSTFSVGLPLVRRAGAHSDSDSQALTVADAVSGRPSLDKS